MKRIAVLGLGNMDLPMAYNLTKGDHTVVGYDILQDLRVAAAAKNVKIASSAQEAVKNAYAVITVLPSAPDVIATWSTLIPLARPGTLFIDCSTIDVYSAKATIIKARHAGHYAVDAPSSGGTMNAARGTLTFMVGGDEESYARATKVLALMGNKAVHCGPAGTGQAVKICNNMVLGISMIAISEAFALAEKLGVSDDVLFDVMRVSSGQCWALTNYCPVPGQVAGSPADNQYKAGFTVEQMLNDMELARETAAAVGALTPLATQAEQLYHLFSAIGGNTKDFSAIITMIKKKIGHSSMPVDTQSKV